MVKEHWADSIIPPLFVWLFMMFDSRYTETQKIRLDAIVFRIRWRRWICEILSIIQMIAGLLRISENRD